MSSGKILVVDDNSRLLNLMRIELESANYEVTTASNQDDAIEAAKREPFDLSLIDLMKKDVRGIAAMAMQKLMLHDWPGNVRELENTIEYAVAMTRHDIIEEDIILPAKDLSAQPLKSLKEAREEFERGYLVRLLEFTGGNVSKAAELAGKYRADFYNLIKKYDLKPDDFKNVKEE